jgi:hypothetical protein
MCEAWVNDATDLQRFLCNTLGLYLQPGMKSVPENELWVMGDDGGLDPISRITDIKMEGTYISYSMKLKKPLEHISLTLTAEKEEEKNG